MAIPSVTFVATTVIVDSGWSVLAGRARFVLARLDRARTRLAGAVLVGAAVGLAPARRS